MNYNQHIISKLKESPTIIKLVFLELLTTAHLHFELGHHLCQTVYYICVLDKMLSNLL